MKHIKVCHFTSAHPSGDVRIFLKECVSLAEAGFDVTLVVANAESLTKDGVKIIGVPDKQRGRISRILFTTKKVYKAALKVDADIYHFHDPELLMYALKLKRKGKKVIFDAHEDVPKQIMGKYYINKYLRKIFSKIFETYENYVVARIDYIITATPTICNRFKKINSSSIDINNYPLEKEFAIPTAWSLKKNEVCYIGGITEIRGITQVIDAMKMVDGVKLNIAGNYSPSSFRNELHLDLIPEKIIEHGFVDRKKTAEIMSNSKAGIVTFLPVPNHVDAQPNKMFEYMSAGIPVIGSFFPLWREIIEGNKCGICVDPAKPNEIAAAIEFIFKNDKEAEEMGKRGCEAILQKYNWNSEALKLVKLYKEL